MNIFHKDAQIATHTVTVAIYRDSKSYQQGYQDALYGERCRPQRVTATVDARAHYLAGYESGLDYRADK